MHCPFCRHPDSRVIDSRTSDDGLSIRRRRQCPECGGRFSTIETASLNVIKRSGVIEPFSREKVMSGVRKACQGRPVTEGDLAVLAQTVEESVRQTDSSQVDTNEIGLAILGPLRELDEVAYLRFASVYQAFDSLEDFEAAIDQLRADHAAATADAGRREGVRSSAAGTSRITWRGCIPSSSAISFRAWIPSRRTTPRWPSSGCSASRRSRGRPARSRSPHRRSARARWAVTSTRRSASRRASTRM